VMTIVFAVVNMFASLFGNKEGSRPHLMAFANLHSRGDGVGHPHEWPHAILAGEAGQSHVQITPVGPNPRGISTFTLP